MVIEGKLYVSWSCPNCGRGEGDTWARADTLIRCPCGHVAHSDPL